MPLRSVVTMPLQMKNDELDRATAESVQRHIQYVTREAEFSIR